MQALELPQIIVAGAPKSGTSSVYFWLAAHPDIYASPVKETFFFADQVSRFNRQANVIDHDLSTYASYFKGRKPGQLCMEATAAYIYQHNALKHIPALPGPPKVIFLLREPGARLYSQYRFERHRTKRITTSWASYASDPQLLSHGRYANYLKPWIDALGEEHVHVDTFENLVSNPAAAMASMANFLGLDGAYYQHYDFVQHNATVAIKSKVLHRLGLQLQRFIPHGVQEALLPLYLRFNAGRMPEKNQEELELLSQVKAAYTEDVQALQTLLPQLDLSSWVS